MNEQLTPQQRLQDIREQAKELRRNPITPDKTVNNVLMQMKMTYQERLEWLVTVADYHKELWKDANKQIKDVAQLIDHIDSIIGDHTEKRIMEDAEIRTKLKGAMDETQ